MRKAVVVGMAVVSSAIGLLSTSGATVVSAQTTHPSIAARWCDQRWGCDDNRHRAWCRLHRHDADWWRWHHDCDGWW